MKFIHIEKYGIIDTSKTNISSVKYALILESDYSKFFDEYNIFKYPADHIQSIELKVEKNIINRTWFNILNTITLKSQSEIDEIEAKKLKDIKWKEFNNFRLNIKLLTKLISGNLMPLAIETLARDEIKLWNTQNITRNSVTNKITNIESMSVVGLNYIDKHEYDLIKSIPGIEFLTVDGDLIDSKNIDGTYKYLIQNEYDNFELICDSELFKNNFATIGFTYNNEIGVDLTFDIKIEIVGFSEPTKIWDNYTILQNSNITETYEHQFSSVGIYNISLYSKLIDNDVYKLIDSNILNVI